MRNIISAIIISIGLIVGGSFAGGRYSLVAVNGGSVARIDRVTGDVQSCQLTAGPKCIWQDAQTPRSMAEQMGIKYPIVLPIPNSSPDPQATK